MASKIIKILFILALAFGLVFSVFLAQKKLSQSNNPGVGSSGYCELKNAACVITIDNKMISVHFTPSPQIEEPLTVRFEGEPVNYIKSVHIEGINMFMGKLPVLKDKSAQNMWQGWTMLGACSEPKMKWKMVVLFTNTTNTAIIEFDTQI